MVFPLGISVRDFFLGINLILECVKAADDVKGARTNYQQLISTLDSILSALKAIIDLDLQNLPISQHQAIEVATDKCRMCTNSFLRSIDKYGSLKALSSPARWSLSSMKTGLCKLNWSLRMKGDVSRFQFNATSHLNSIQVLLTTLIMYENMTFVSCHLDC
jgi:hypothetical protein